MEQRTIGECFYQIRNGANIKQGETDGGFPITRIETTANDKFNRDRMGYAGITDIGKYESYVLEDGDLLMSHINSVQYLGRTVLYRKQGDETIIHGMNLLGLKAKRDILEPAYARYYFYSHPFRKQLSQITKKSVNQASFTVADLKKLTVMIPSLTEQNEVVFRLNKIKSILTARQQQLAKLDELIKARFVEMFGDYVETATLDSVATVSGGLTKNAKRNKLPLRMPYLRVANVAFATINVSEMLEIGLTEEECKKTLLQDEDILFVEGNGSPDQIGRVAIWRSEVVPCVHQNHLIKSRFDKGVVIPVFAMYYFMSPKGREQIRERAVSTSGLYTLSVSKIAALMLPTPPMELQECFAAFVAQVDKSKVAVQKALDEAQLLFDSLMQQYFG